MCIHVFGVFAEHHMASCTDEVRLITSSPSKRGYPLGFANTRSDWFVITIELSSRHNYRRKTLAQRAQSTHGLTPHHRRGDARCLVRECHRRDVCWLAPEELRHPGSARRMLACYLHDCGRSYNDESSQVTITGSSRHCRALQGSVSPTHLLRWKALSCAAIP